MKSKMFPSFMNAGFNKYMNMIRGLGGLLHNYNTQLSPRDDIYDMIADEMNDCGRHLFVRGLAQLSDDRCDRIVEAEDLNDNLSVVPQLLFNVDSLTNKVDPDVDREFIQVDLRPLIKLKSDSGLSTVLVCGDGTEQARRAAFTELSYIYTDIGIDPSLCVVDDGITEINLDGVMTEFKTKFDQRSSDPEYFDYNNQLKPTKYVPIGKKNPLLKSNKRVKHDSLGETVDRKRTAKNRKKNKLAKISRKANRS